MKYNITFSLTIDPDANFLESNRDNNLSVIEELIITAIYEIDDVTLGYLEVEEDD